MYMSIKYFWRCSLQTWLDLLAAGLLPRSAGFLPFNEDDWCPGVGAGDVMSQACSISPGGEFIPLRWSSWRRTEFTSPPPPLLSLSVHPSPPPPLSPQSSPLSLSGVLTVKADML